MREECDFFFSAGHEMIGCNPVSDAQRERAPEMVDGENLHQDFLFSVSMAGFRPCQIQKRANVSCSLSVAARSGEGSYAAARATRSRLTLEGKTCDG